MLLMVVRCAVGVASVNVLVYTVAMLAVLMVSLVAVVPCACTRFGSIAHMCVRGVCLRADMLFLTVAVRRPRGRYTGHPNARCS